MIFLLMAILLLEHPKNLQKTPVAGHNPA